MLSKNYKHWISMLDPKTCLACLSAHGKIYGIYENPERHLPEAYGRIWYEADLNYKFGFRNVQRILWSNDGLIFVTYDHYKTFYEIV